ncbi:cytochrome c-type biogenesis protein [Flocculibacter collagenilyticus]|uniref:cytochrome c-type biogenesis protein n=1 Tax=Flocculibacter collagenilyticus TaxID=2744479 RepID=UPI0018F5A3EC|nr:cytochrome c-type biogenesis protein [Flocculibacter collagenilyticus]
MKYGLISLLVLVIHLPVFAVEEIRSFNNATEQRIYQELIAELRCPKCQNQNVADSNAIVAIDIKDKVYELVTEGKDKDDVISFMIDRYGYFVHYKPPITMVTILLWVIPVVFILLAIVTVLFKTRHPAKDESAWNEEKEQQVNVLISQYGSGRNQ